MRGFGSLSLSQQQLFAVVVEGRPEATARDERRRERRKARVGGME
jgi:hypothetical protein